MESPRETQLMQQLSSISLHALNTIVHHISEETSSEVDENTDLPLALAALCNALARLMETFEMDPAQLESLVPHIQRVQETRPIEAADSNRVLLDEIDLLLFGIRNMCKNSRPPSYCEHHIEQELDKVLGAIDRVIDSTPRLQSQEFVLSEAQQKKFDSALIFTIVDRLLKNKPLFEEQRADMITDSKYAKLNTLVGQISAAHHRGMHNQRAALNPDKVESANISKGLNSMKQRYTNQDWVDKDIVLLDELQRLLASLDNQRAEISSNGALTMQIGSIIGRVEKAEQRRFCNQDSLSEEALKEQRFEKIEKILSGLKPRMESQTASLRSKK